MLPSITAPQLCLAQPHPATWHHGESLPPIVLETPTPELPKAWGMPVGTLYMGRLWHSGCRDRRDTCSLILWSPEIPSGPIFLWLLTTTCCQDGFAMLAAVSQQLDCSQTPVSCWHQLVLACMAQMICSCCNLRLPITTTKKATQTK